jgi:Domain of unknown function (DUF4417)
MVSLAVQEPTRNLREERRLWHDGSRFPMSLGCISCPDRSLCGGLRIESSVFDCLGFCCNRPDDCDAVCRNNPEGFSTRVREIKGFRLDNVPRARVLPAPSMSPLVPVIFHGNCRADVFTAPRMVCLPLYKVVTGNGLLRDKSASELAKRFRVAPGTGIVLTGTAVDPPLEKWWSLGDRRRDAIRRLRDINISLVTTPNYSLFTDQPRWDDLHSMKRIAIVHEEFLSEGIPAALHVNARTERDWESWCDYIAARPEVTHIAFEFGTGAGWAGRIDWHIAQLAKLAAAVTRPLHLILRGGIPVLSPLAAAYPKMTLLETTTFWKTIKRRHAVPTVDGRIRWRHSPTEAGQPLDALLAENWAATEISYERYFGKLRMQRAA